MDPKRHSIPEANAYRTLHVVMAHLRRAERTLAEIEQRGPDPQRALHLVAIRAALAQRDLRPEPAGTLTGLSEQLRARPELASR
jgi:hypothetical protein